jgi:putative DNA primase/helicase
MNPGCKVDTMTILEGKQGVGKSTLFNVLFGEWYAEVTNSINDKDFFMALRGVWCSDFGELDQFGKADRTRVKQVLTQREDHYRPSYGRNTIKFLAKIYLLEAQIKMTGIMTKLVQDVSCQCVLNAK